MVDMDQVFWTTVINDVSTAILTSGLFVALIKKFPIIGKAALYVGEHAAEIVHGAEVIGKEILSTPAGAIAAHSLHAEVDRVTEDFKKSEVAKLALIGLHNFGHAYTNLSDTQKVALTRFVIDSVPKEWNINDKTVIEVLAETEKAVDYFGSLEIVKAANIFTEAQKANAVSTVTASV
jgi:hypothetical protein